MQGLKQSLLDNRNYRAAAIMALALSLWLASAYLPAGSAPAADNRALSERPLQRVAVREIQAQLIDVVVDIRARTEAQRTLELRAQIGGRVLQLGAEEGAVVAADQVLCTLADDDRSARWREAQAGVAHARLAYQGALRLESGGYQSQLAIAQAQAALRNAEATLRQRELELEYLQIAAPFAAVLATQSVEIGSLLNRGDLCATLLELDPLVVRGQVSETEVGLLQLGGAVSVTLASGEQRAGQLRYIAVDADPRTRSYRVEALLPNPDLRWRAGLSAQMRVAVARQHAQLLPAALLSLDDDGEIGVKTVDGEQRVNYHRVRILRDDPRGVWVAGLPARSLLITVGQEYVSAGDRVDPVLVDDPVDAGPVDASPVDSNPAAVAR